MVDIADQHELHPYLTTNLQLIPLQKWDTKDAKGRERGKSPRDGRWQVRAYVSKEVIAEAVRDGTNVGVRLPAEIVVVDSDPRNFPPGRNVLEELNKAIGLGLETAPHTITGSGGDHYWFRKDPNVILMDSLPDYPGVEFKSKGRQVVAAGSRHPNGEIYRWDPLGPDLRDIRMLPDRVTSLARRPPPSANAGVGAGEADAEQLEGMLALLNPEDFQEHDKWRDLMMACHQISLGEGRQEFIDWSTQDPKYGNHAWEIGRRWDSLHIAREGVRNVTARYLYKCILATGQLVPNAPAEYDFEPLENSPEDLSMTDEVDGVERELRTEDLPLIDQLNKTHCVVNDGGRFRIFTECEDPALGKRYYVRSSRTDFEDLYSNRLIEVGETIMPLGRWWLRQAGRRQYNGVLFDPERQYEGWLNLWRGWSVEARAGKWDKLRDLVFEVLCNGNKEGFEYVLNWAAYMIQRPSKPAEVALAFRGNKGTGKGTWGRALTKLCGGHGLHISSPEHLTGRFNSHLRDCICLFADEAFWAGDKAGESVLKQLVTEPTLTFEGKGKDAESGRNMIHIVMASNNDWVVPAGVDGERRFAVFEVNDNARGDASRFSAIHNQLEREGGYEAMLWDLMTRDLGDWAPRNNLPAGSGSLLHQQIRSMDIVTDWWYNLLQEGELEGARNSWRSEDGTWILKSYVRSSFNMYARERGTRSVLPSIQAFGSRLKVLVPSIEAKQLKVKRKEESTASVDTLNRAMFHWFPSLKTCRQFMANMSGTVIEWDTPHEEQGEEMDENNRTASGGTRMTGTKNPNYVSHPMGIEAGKALLGGPKKVAQTDEADTQVDAESRDSGAFMATEKTEVKTGNGEDWLN